MAYHPSEEAPTERLLHIYLEPRPSYGGDHRHIATSVVRRAMSHVPNESGDGYKAYWDDKHASGYRNALWSNSTQRGVFVGDLHVRGQIDAYGPDKLRDGKPYGNEPWFTPYRVNASDARKIAKTFEHLAKQFEKLSRAGHVFKHDDFADAVRQHALSLGIKKCIVRRKDWSGANLSTPDAFIEFELKDIQYYVDDLLARLHDHN